MTAVQKEIQNDFGQLLPARYLQNYFPKCKDFTLTKDEYIGIYGWALVNLGRLTDNDIRVDVKPAKNFPGMYYVKFVVKRKK